jgi:hypothetical protein
MQGAKSCDGNSVTIFEKQTGAASSSVTQLLPCSFLLNYLASVKCRLSPVGSWRSAGVLFVR